MSAGSEDPEVGVACTSLACVLGEMLTDWSEDVEGRGKAADMGACRALLTFADMFAQRLQSQLSPTDWARFHEDTKAYILETRKGLAVASPGASA